MERKATALGGTLPASTIATTLGRVTLPREPFVDVFTRVCGLGDEEVRQWLDVRRRIAMGNQSQTDDHADGDQTDGDQVPAPDASKDSLEPRSRRGRRTASLIAAMGIAVVGTLGVRALLFGTCAPSTTPPAAPAAAPMAELAILAVGSWGRIHPARAPELCLTEGMDRTQRYSTAIAAQHPCTQAVLPSPTSA